MHRPAYVPHISIVCSIAVAFGLVAAAHALQPESPRKTLRYGGDSSFMPLEWMDRSGDPHGFQVDLIRAIGDAVDCDVSIQLDVWSRTFHKLETGEIDVVAMYDQPSRRELVDFSSAFEIGAGEIFVRTNSPPIRSLQELNNKSVIVQDLALATHELPKRGINPHFIPVASEAEAILLLASGKHDCAIATTYGGRYAMRHFRLTNVTTTFEPILVSNICFVVRKGDAETLAFLNRGLDLIRANGTFNVVHDRWFNELDHPAVPVRSVILLAAWILGPLLLLLVVALIWNRTLRYRVANRTSALQTELAQRQMVESALRESEERLRVAISASHITVAHQDRDLRYTWLYNSPSDYKTQTFLYATDADLFSPEAAERLVTLKRRVIETGIGEEDELQMRNGDNPLWMRVVIEPLRDAAEEIVGVTSVMIDITALKRSEQQNIELERRVRQAQKLESLGLLAGGVAHDFSNLLTGVAGNTALALQDAPPGSRLRERIESIEQIARRAKDLTQELLSLAGRRGGDLQRVELAELVRDTIDLFRSTHQPPVSIQMQPAPRLPPLEANQTGLRQAMMNLLHNAVDACAARSGHVTICIGQADYSRAELQNALIGTNEPAGTFQFVEVSDDGIGMTAQNLPRIFDPFFTTKPSGRGFGLAIVAGTIMRHRGAIFVKSAPGRGTTIRLLLPVGRSAAAQGTQPSAYSRHDVPRSAPSAADSVGEILIVDDNEVVREMMVLGLQRAGFVVHAAVNMETALSIVSGKATLIAAILDVNLEHENGLNILTMIREQLGALPIVVVSGGDDAIARQRLAADPHAVFLQKPFALQELLQTLRNLLGQTGTSMASLL